MVVAAPILIAVSALTAPPSFAGADATVPAPDLVALSASTADPCTKTATLTMIKLGTTGLNGTVVFGAAAAPGASPIATIHTNVPPGPDVGSFLWSFQSPINDDNHVVIAFEASRAVLRGGNVKFDALEVIPSDAPWSITATHRCITGDIWFSLKAGTSHLLGCALQGRLADGGGPIATVIGSDDISLRLNGSGDLGRTGTVDCARP